MSGRGMVGAAMAILEAREAFGQAREAQRELMESEVGSAVGRMAWESLRRANEERLARALQWLGAHLLDALESGQGVELVKALGGEVLAPPPAEMRSDEAEVESAGEAEEVSGPDQGDDVAAVRVDAEVLAELQRRLRENQGGTKATDARVVGSGVTVVSADRLSIAVQNALVQAGRVLGPTPVRLSGGNAIEAEVKRLEEALRITLVHWGAAGKKVDHALTSWVAARARAAQEAMNALLGEARARQIGPRIDAVISGLGRHTKETWPGTVHGLARGHRPRGENWSVDAVTWGRKARNLLPHEAILDEVEVEDEAVVSGSVDDRLRSLREDLRAGRDGSELVSEIWQMVVQDGAIGRGDARLAGLVRELVEREENPLVALAELGLGSLGLGEVERVVRDELTEDAEVERPALPGDWAGFVVTRGVAAAIVGGVPRPERVEALKRCFGFGSLEWIPNACDRPLESIVQRMRSGSLQLVIMLSQLVSHSASDRLFAARDEGCRVVLADSYGVGQIRLALERYAASAIG